MKKKVLHLLYSDRLSGAESVAISIIDNLSDEYDLLYVSKNGPIKEILEEKNIKYRLVDKIDLKTVKRIIKEEKPDIIHAHDYFASTYAALSGFKGEIISHIHNDYPFAKKWNKYTLLFSHICSKFNKIVFVSNQIYENAIYKKKIKNPIVINNIIDYERIKTLSKENDTDKHYDIAYIGRLTDQKNPITFIKIIKKISIKKPTIKAVILGDGDLRSNCENLIKEYNLKDNLEIKGFIKNPFPVIKNSTCIIMPSKYEGLSLAAVECLVLEKPVFNSGVSGFDDIYNKKNVYLCKNIDEYVEKVLNYLNKPTPLNINLDKFTNKTDYYNKIKELYNE